MSLKAKIDITTNNLKKIKNKTDTENKSENKLKSRKSDNIKSKFTFSDLLNFEDELKIIENIDIQDTDFNSAFTIKTYTSVKETTEEGWQHNSILLRPNSFDSSYKDIIVNEENGSGMRVVGEFVCIIK